MTNQRKNDRGSDQIALMEFAPASEFAQGEVGRIVSRPSEREGLYDVVYQQWNRNADTGEWEDEMRLGWLTEEQRKDASIPDIIA